MLNILPEQIKRRNKRYYIYSLLLLVLQIFTLTLLVVNILLFIAYGNHQLILNLLGNSGQNTKNNLTAEAQKLNRAYDMATEALSGMKNFKPEYIGKFFQYFDEFPGNVALSEVGFAFENKQVNILATGLTDDKDALVDVLKYLQGKDGVIRVEIPIESLQPLQDGLLQFGIKLTMTYEQ